MWVIYDKGTVSKSTIHKRFAHFRSGNFDVKDEPRSGLLMIDNNDEILEKISTHDISNELYIHHRTALNRLQRARYKKKLDVWKIGKLWEYHSEDMKEAGMIANKIMLCVWWDISFLYLKITLCVSGDISFLYLLTADCQLCLVLGHTLRMMGLERNRPLWTVTAR